MNPIKRLLGKTGILTDYGHRGFEIPRSWSNLELARFSGRYKGAIVNVSAWEDKDKQGRRYRDYFTSGSEYYMTNFGTDQGVLQNVPNEYFVDLELPLRNDLKGRFDVAFNHTCLEHIWDFRAAFGNLCALSKDTVIIVVPWMQALHTDYGDYWRFSPQAIVRLFAENGLTALHVSWNEAPMSATYVFCIASRRPEHWVREFEDLRPIRPSADLLRLPPNFAGRTSFCWRPWRKVQTRRMS